MATLLHALVPPSVVQAEAQILASHRALLLRQPAERCEPMGAAGLMPIREQT